jgi:glycosyltransferase involved in cell wall biosynthesis
MVTRGNRTVTRRKRPLVRLSAVICSLNGAAGVGRCLRALGEQTIRSSMEVIVVDDGSTDATSEVAGWHGALVIRHPENRGVSAARNSGVQAASAPVVAFLDDDCEPEPRWAEQLLAGYGDDVVAVGGPLVPAGEPGLMLGYLIRHNPLEPQELELAESSGLGYRLRTYLRRQWERPRQKGRRDVLSFASANMSVRRQEFLEIGGFDERIRFGSEDEDLCWRLRRAFPRQRLVFVPGARARHHFESSLRDMVRRRRAYGRGAAMMYRKWPNTGPVFFPVPVIVLALLVLSVRRPALAVAAAAAPHVFYPAGLRAAFAQRQARCVLDAYLQLAQETGDDLGFIQGLWRYRDWPGREDAADARPATTAGRR